MINLTNARATIMDVATREDGVRLLQKIEWCGRISHRSEDAATETSWERFIQAVVVNKGDWSIVEHAIVSVDMTVDRDIVPMVSQAEGQRKAR